MRKARELVGRAFATTHAQVGLTVDRNRRLPLANSGAEGSPRITAS